VAVGAQVGHAESEMCFDNTHFDQIGKPLISIGRILLIAMSSPRVHSSSIRHCQDVAFCVLSKILQSNPGLGEKIGDVGLCIYQCNTSEQVRNVLDKFIKEL
jgi:hypothetical protein